MIGDKIKSRRIALGLTQEELAHKLGYKSKSTINKIELNKHDIDSEKIKRFAAALECAPVDLIDTPTSEPFDLDKFVDFARRLKALPPELQSNVYQYIAFLEKSVGGEI